MVATKTILKWVLVTAIIFITGIAMISGGYAAGIGTKLSETLLVMGLIICYGSVTTLVVEGILLIAKLVGYIKKKHRLA